MIKTQQYQQKTVLKCPYPTFPPKAHIVYTIGLTSQGKKTPGVLFSRTAEVVRGQKMGRDTLQCPLQNSLKGLSDISKASSEGHTDDSNELHRQAQKNSDTTVLNENAVLTKPTLGETCLTLFSNNLGRSASQIQMDFSKQ